MYITPRGHSKPSGFRMSGFAMMRNTTSWSLEQPTSLRLRIRTTSESHWEIQRIHRQVMASPIVRLSRKRGRRTSREPKAKSVKQPTSPLFQQGQATNIFEYCRVYARPRKPSKNCRPQTGRQVLSFTHMKSRCLIHKAWLSLAERNWPISCGICLGTNLNLSNLSIWICGCLLSECVYQIYGIPVVNYNLQLP